MNTYKYKACLKVPLVNIEKLPQKYEKGLLKLSDMIGKNPNTRPYAITSEKYSGEGLGTKYGPLLKPLANIIGVKLMWFSGINPETGKALKTIRIIGTSRDIAIFTHSLDYLIESISWYRDKMLNRYTRTEVRELVNRLRRNLAVIAVKVLEKADIDTPYLLHLEKYIIVMESVKFKEYQTHTKRYKHTISRKFNHRRMVN